MTSCNVKNLPRISGVIMWHRSEVDGKITILFFTISYIRQKMESLLVTSSTIAYFLYNK